MIMPSGQQLLLPANPLFIWGEPVGRVGAQFCPEHRAGPRSLVARFSRFGAGILGSAPATAHWHRHRLSFWGVYGCATSRTAGPACLELCRHVFWSHRHEPPFTVVQRPIPGASSASVVCRCACVATCCTHAGWWRFSRCFRVRGSRTRSAPLASCLSHFAGSTAPRTRP